MIAVAILVIIGVVTVIRFRYLLGWLVNIGGREGGSGRAARMVMRLMTLTPTDTRNVRRLGCVASARALAEVKRRNNANRQ